MSMDQPSNTRGAEALAGSPNNNRSFFFPPQSSDPGNEASTHSEHANGAYGGMGHGARPPEADGMSTTSAHDASRIMISNDLSIGRTPISPPPQSNSQPVSLGRRKSLVTARNSLMVNPELEMTGIGLQDSNAGLRATTSRMLADLEGTTLSLRNVRANVASTDFRSTPYGVQDWSVRGEGDPDPQGKPSNEPGEETNSSPNGNAPLTEQRTREVSSGCFGTPILPTSPAKNRFQRAMHIIHVALTGDRSSWMGMFATSIVSMSVFLAIGLVVFESLPYYRLRAIQGVSGEPETTVTWLEAWVVGIFTLEYTCRLVTSPFVPHAHAPVCPHHACWRRLLWRIKQVFIDIITFIFSFMNLVDLASILPYYIALGGNTSLKTSTVVLRAVWLGRILRLITGQSKNASFQILIRALREAAYALLMLLLWLSIAVVFFGALIFYCESGTYSAETGTWMRSSVDGQSTEATPFLSIVHSFYYVIVTLTTTGYGDFVPTSDWGRFVACVIMICGILCLALPISIVGQKFQDEYQKYMKGRQAKVTNLRFNWLFRPRKTTAMTPGKLPSVEDVKSKAAVRPVKQSAAELPKRPPPAPPSTTVPALPRASLNGLGSPPLAGTSTANSPARLGTDGPRSPAGSEAGRISSRGEQTLVALVEANIELQEFASSTAQDLQWIKAALLALLEAQGLASSGRATPGAFDAAGIDEPSEIQGTGRSNALDPPTHR